MVACFLAAAVAVYGGVQVLVLSGVHRDVAGSQSGIAGAALLQAGIATKRFEVHLEGVPPVALPQRPSVYYGQATPQLSLLDGTIRFAIDRPGTLRLGAGEMIVNQRTPLPNLNQVVASRLAGVRFEVADRLPLAHSTFIEMLAGAVPSLNGGDHYAFSNGEPAIDKSERASEFDASVALGFRVSGGEFLAGFRTLNFSAKFLSDGQAADRNSGTGVMLEYRRFIKE